jgi:Tol biopolymer transport system component
MESEGHGGTRVMHTPVAGGRPEVLIDLPGAYSHEYFPTMTPDGRWLVWGAAAEGHEHDRADYEIFVWRVGTPPESARRVTYSTSNDQWPDLRLND